MGSSNDLCRERTPEGSSVACIWMSSGLISYKLCDRSFNCEHCPLDAALTGARPAPLEDDNSDSPPSHLWQLPEDRYYGPNHLWVLFEKGCLLRLGLDAFASRLLSRLSGVRFAETGESLSAGEAFCEVEIAGGAIPLTSPASGRLTEVNARLIHSPSVLQRDPYQAGWLCLLESRQEEPLPGYIDAAARQRELTYDLTHFRRRLASVLLSESPGLGAVMADGGEPLTDLHQILGSEGLLKLLRETLA